MHRQTLSNFRFPLRYKLYFKEINLLKNLIDKAYNKLPTATSRFLPPNVVHEFCKLPCATVLAENDAGENAKSSDARHR